MKIAFTMLLIALFLNYIATFGALENRNVTKESKIFIIIVNILILTKILISI